MDSAEVVAGVISVLPLGAEEHWKVLADVGQYLQVESKAQVGSRLGQEELVLPGAKSVDTMRKSYQLLVVRRCQSQLLA